MKSKSLILCLLLAGLLNRSEAKVIVKTSLGYIEGTTSVSSRGIEFFSFLGVPYAEPPVKNLRFKDPIAKKPWNGTLKATKDGKVCPQPEILFNRTVMSEDCLVLNIHTRNIKRKKPVLFHIHGGAYIVGSGHSVLQTGPHYLLNHNVVLVTMNHRLGPFGFASTKDRFMTGNFGLKDIVLALKRVKTDIHHFGGDPNKITVMGHSAGAASVSLLMISPMSHGLFHRAIAMSGSSLNYITHDPTKWTKKLAMETGCTSKDNKKMIECLRKVSWEKIIDTASSWEEYPLDFITLRWNSVVETNFGQKMFLPKPIDDYFEKGVFMKVPFMVGIVANEFDYYGQLYMQKPQLAQEINDDPQKHFPYIFGYPPEYYNNSNEVTDDIRKVYMNNKNLTNETSTEFGNIFSDSVVRYSVNRLVNAVRNSSDIFTYLFTRKGNYSSASEWAEPDADLGVVHEDDQQYLFTSKRKPRITPLDKDHETVDMMTSLVVNFASNGNPNFGQEPSWTPSNSSEFVVFRLGDNFIG